MILLWVTLLLHQGYTLTPVTTVDLGDRATLTCALPNKDRSSRTLYWYKQSAGDTLKSIVTLYRSTNPRYTPEFTESRWEVNQDDSFFNLTILRTIQEDEGMYHCGKTEWVDVEWSGTYLSLRGNTRRTSNYSVVQLPPPSAPVEIEQANPAINTPMVVLIVCLGISLIGNVILICKRKVKEQFKGTESATPDVHSQSFGRPDFNEAEEELNYSALNFSTKDTRGRKKRDFAGDSLYSQVKQ